MLAIALVLPVQVLASGASSTSFLGVDAFLFAEVLCAIPSSKHRLLEARLSGSDLLTGALPASKAAPQPW